MSANPVRLFIGWDSKEPIAFQVFAHSLLRRSSVPLVIVPLALNGLGRIFTRQRGPLESTEFSFTRFLVPYLCDYKGLAVFADSDMLCLTDPAELIADVEAHPGKAVYCVKHDYTPKPSAKFLGQPQTRYEKKNWSSLMVMDTARCRALTPTVVNAENGLYLHRFHWLESDDHVGALDPRWNHLVGEYDKCHDAKILHFTLGTPAFPEYRHSDHADDWWQEYAHMNAPIGAWAKPERYAVARAADYPVPPMMERF